MKTIGEHGDVLRQLAVTGRPMIVLAHDKASLPLVGIVRDALSACGRLADLREVRLSGYDPSLPTGAEAYRIDPVEGAPTAAWAEKDPDIAWFRGKRVLADLTRLDPSQAGLPMLAEADATAASRVVVVTGGVDSHADIYAIWLLERGVERARAEDRPEPALVSGFFLRAMAEFPDQFGFEGSRLSGREDFLLLSTQEWLADWKAIDHEAARVALDEAADAQDGPPSIGPSR